MLLEDWQSSDPNDDTAGLNDYVQSIIPSTFGNVNDDTGVTSYRIRYYSGLGFGSWVSETNWTTSSNIAVNKIFTASNIKSSLPSSGVNANNVYSRYFSPAIGYTIEFLREDAEPFQKDNVLLLNLELNDRAMDSTKIADLLFKGGTGGISTVAIVNSTNKYSNSFPCSLLDLVPLSGSTFTVCQFSNLVTIGGITPSGDEVVIDTISNISSLNVEITMPEEIQYIYVDVEYTGSSISSISNSSLGSTNDAFIPAVYNFDLSGTIEFDDGSIITGVLNSIIEWLRNILNAIRELPDKIVDGIKVVLQELFVPSPEFISGKFEEFKLLAESKLGFLFTMLDMVVELFRTLSTNISDPMETLTIPSLVLPFPYADDGQMVLWEDMTFKVFPDGLDVLLNLVHLVTSIVIITATINFSVSYIRRFFEKG